jgi:hypothetical protein
MLKIYKTILSNISADKLNSALSEHDRNNGWYKLNTYDMVKLIITAFLDCIDDIMLTTTNHLLVSNNPKCNDIHKKLKCTNDSFLEIGNTIRTKRFYCRQCMSTMMDIIKIIAQNIYYEMFNKYLLVNELYCIGLNNNDVLKLLQYDVILLQLS